MRKLSNMQGRRPINLLLSLRFGIGNDINLLSELDSGLISVVYLY